MRGFLILAVAVAMATAGKGSDKKREATADFPFGKITFEQKNEFAPVEVEVKFDGAYEGVAGIGGYHIHTFPIKSDTWGKKTMSGDAQVCTTTGGHYNPYGVQYPETGDCDEDNPYATCEVGDLSAKHPIEMDSNNNIKQTYTDNSLSLFGSMSILGRSIVLHKKSDGSRWYCSDIVFKGDTTVYTATSSKGDDYNALDTVTMIADYNNEDSAIFVTIDPHAEGAVKFHVHDDPISNNNCLSTGKHYDPYMAAKNYKGETNTAFKVYYANMCRMNPAKCEVGDLSGKFGSLDAAGRYFFTDSNLPGANSRSSKSGATIKGRSIVFHNTDGDRIACSNILLANKDMN